jgi:N-acylneuraminate cytidylyltransferase
MAARDARRVDRVVVSTDDGAIAAVAVDAGAEVVLRPAELSADSASSESAVLHALDTYRTNGSEFDVVVMIQCTSPFTIAADIDGTIACLDDARVDCAFTAARSHGFLWREGDGLSGAVAVNHDATVRVRRQDRPPEYVETGAVYAMRTPGFCAARHRFFGRAAIYEVPASRSLEIDEPADLVLAAALAHLPRQS